MTRTRFPHPGLARLLGAAVALSAAAVLVVAAPATASPLMHAPNTSWQTNGTVRAVVFSKDGSTVYVAGLFTKVRPPGAAAGTSEVSRLNAAAFDVATDSLLPWDPRPNGTVWTMALAPGGGRVYLGGVFTSVQGAHRKHVAAVSATSGAPTKFHASTNGRVQTLLVDPHRKRVYLGGTFEKVNGKIHHRIVALRTRGGTVATRFRAQVNQVQGTCPPRCPPVVASLALTRDGSRLFVGGHFGLLSGVRRNNAGAVDARTGRHVKAWNPNVYHLNISNPNQKNTVYQIVPNGKHVFICGDFQYVGGHAHPNVAKTFSATGATVGAFKGRDDGGTQACVLSGGLLYLGGHFMKIDGTTRVHIGAVNARTGALDPWNPSANSSRGVHAFDTHGRRSSFVLGVGGEFTKIGGTSQQGFARFTT
jgi:hypothetical protein